MGAEADQAVVLIVGIILVIAGLALAFWPKIVSRQNPEAVLQHRPFVVGGVLCALAGAYFTVMFFSPSDQITLEANLLRQAEEVNKSLPRQLDENTRFDSVAVFGTEVHYEHTIVNYTADQLDRDVIQGVMIEKLIKEQCPKEELVEMLRNGVRYHYNYYGELGGRVASVVISRNICGIK